MTVVSITTAVVLGTGALLGFGYLLGYHDGAATAADRQRWVHERARWTQQRMWALERWVFEAMALAAQRRRPR